MPAKKRYFYERKTIDCPKGEVAIVHETIYPLAWRIYREGLKPRCNLPKKFGKRALGAKETYFDEPESLRRCSVFAYLQKHRYDGYLFPICACINPKKAFVAESYYADEIYEYSEKIRDVLRDMKHLESGKKARIHSHIPNEEILRRLKEELSLYSKNVREATEAYNDSMIRLDKYLSSKNKLAHGEVEILIPEGIRADQIKKCAKRKKTSYEI
jgi:hypothetical protein